MTALRVSSVTPPSSSSEPLSASMYALASALASAQALTPSVTAVIARPMPPAAMLAVFKPTFIDLSAPRTSLKPTTSLPAPATPRAVSPPAPASRTVPCLIGSGRSLRESTTPSRPCTSERSGPSAPSPMPMSSVSKDPPSDSRSPLRLSVFVAAVSAA